MGRARDHLRRARRDLHKECAVPALYLATSAALPIPCTVRVHDNSTANGKPGGGDQGYAQQADASPRLIFLTDDAPKMIRQNAIVSVEPGEAYRVMAADPPHDITISVKVTRMSAAETTGLPVPGDG